MSDAKKATNEVAKTDTKAPAEGEGKRGWGSWALGWVLAPGLIIGMIFGGGALVGAHFHDSWFVEAIVWVVGLFS